MTGLAANTNYYFRVGAINYNNVVNYTIMSATRTIAGFGGHQPAHLGSVRQLVNGHLDTGIEHDRL